MRKIIIIVMAVVLLAAAGARQGLVAVGITGVYEDEFVSELENVSDEMIPAVGESGLISENIIDKAWTEPPELEADISEENEISEETPQSVEEIRLEGFASEFTVLSSHEAVVKSFEELKSALANDNGITTVYFGADITMQGGIKINPKKADVVISGLNPLESGWTQPYTLTDMDSHYITDTVYVSEAGTRTIHIRDLAMIGKNYYGPISVAEVIGLAGLVITYERVSYDGPQLCHNRGGTARFINISARIHGGNGLLSPHQEFSEAKHLVFEGANTIYTTSSTNSIFWHPLGGSFRIGNDSLLIITSPNTSTTFGVFYADGLANKMNIAIGSRSVLEMTISGVVAPELNVTISGLTVNEGGAFRLNTANTDPAAALRVGGELVVARDAVFSIYGDGGATQPLLRQQGGNITVGKDAVFRIFAEKPYSALLELVGRELLCGDPSSVVLYNGGRDIAASTNAGRVYINAQQANYWRSTVPDGFDFPPLYGWRKADKSNLMIDGTLAIGSNANFSKVVSNYAAGDPPGLPPDPTTFNMATSRILSFGRLELVVAEPAVKSVSVGGVTASGASVRVSFTQREESYTFDVKADYHGRFHVPVGVELEAGTVINLKSSWNYLTEEAEVTVREEGSLGLFAPDILEFYTTPLSPFRQTVKRLNPDWKIVVSDARESGGQWSVYAKLDPEPAHPSDLEGALVFVDDSGQSSVLSTETDILILEHTSSAGEDVLPILWDEDRGILLDIQPGTTFVDRLYTATICWTVVDGV